MQDNTIQDQVFLSERGVLVTRTRLASSLSPTFQMRNLSAVDLSWSKNPRRSTGFILIGFGILLALGGVFIVGDAIGFLIGLVGAALVAAPIYFRKFFFGRWYTVYITTTSSPMRFEHTQDAVFASRVRDAINDAWAAAA